MVLKKKENKLNIQSIFLILGIDASNKKSTDDRFQIQTMKILLLHYGADVTFFQVLVKFFKILHN